MLSNMNNDNGYSYCAGTLPYAFYNNSVYILMGKNKNGRLCSFSGKNEDSETIVETACREMWEETCGVVMSKTDILKHLGEDCIVLESQTPRGKKCYIMMFEIPYRKWYAPAFIRMQDSLKSIVKSHGGDVGKYTEMVDIKWISIDSFCTNVRRSWDNNKMSLSNSEWCKVHDLKRKARCQH